jgi:hypothetical protein
MKTEYKSHSNSMAFIYLAITVAIVYGLFVGGRALLSRRNPAAKGLGGLLVLLGFFIAADTIWLNVMNVTHHS